MQRTTLFNNAEEKKKLYDFHIEKLKKQIELYRRTLKDDSLLYYAPEQGFFAEGIGNTSIEKLSLGIEAHTKRLEILNKMKNGESISSEEHNKVLALKALKEDKSIAEYANVKPAVTKTM